MAYTAREEGLTLGEFVVREPIGEGAFGMVYRADQPKLAREAVVKVLHRRHRNPAMVQRFLQEARIASHFDHPYAAHIYAFGAEPDGVVWIAMELVRGTPLSALLRTQGPMPLPRFVPLLDRIAEVIAAAHEQGIVHRDIKPSNVMVVTRAGRLLPKLLDFGIAKLASQADEPVGATGMAEGEADTIAAAPSQTRTNALMGTPQYMAPELWVDSRVADARSDQYALGVLCYEALTGRIPFEQPNLKALAIAHAFDPVPPLGAPLPPALDAVLARALAKKPEDRYASVLELSAAVRSAAGLGEAHSPTPELDEEVRKAAVLGAPRPIADAVAALESATSPHQARDCAFRVVDVAARWLGILALAGHSRIGTVVAPGIGESLRTLRRRAPTTAEWIELACALTRSASRYGVHPMPELASALDEDSALVRSLRALVELRASTERGDAGDEAVRKLLEKLLPELAALLRNLEFLGDYPLVVPRGGFVEQWMGARRGRPPARPPLGRVVADGQPLLVDRDGGPVLQLAPLVQVAPPVPGADDELFLFDGPGRHGAKLVALPHGFERHDEAVWTWFGSALFESRASDPESNLEERPPYRGLAAFTADDAGLFFGREQEAVALLNRLRITPFLAVVGPSGAGKSSFVHAGVLPDLPDGFRAVALRPGPSPLASLRARLGAAGIPVDTNDPAAIAAVVRSAAAARGETVVLVVDQLEELFTMGAPEDEQRRFAEVLSQVARSPDDPVRIIATLRDDFLMAAERLPALRERLTQGVALVGTPQPADLRRILVEPLRRAGYDFEDPALPDEMVREVAGQPAALPLLSFAAAQLWELRDRHFRTLTRQAYAALGGVGGALARHGEEVLAAVPPDAQRLVREAFRHLVTAEGTRQVMGRGELLEVLGGDARARQVIERLLSARLLVSESADGRDHIEIAHEALLGAWPRLVDWLREDAEGTRLRDQLRTAAHQWDERGRPRGLLWRDEALAEYQLWRARHPGALPATEEAFARASVDLSVRGRRVRRSLLAASFAALGVVSAVLYGMNRREVRAREEAHRRLVEGEIEQGRTALLGGRHWEALAHLTEALREGGDSPQLQLMRGLALGPARAMIYRIHAHEGRINDVHFAPDGSRFVTAGLDGAALWETESGKLVHRLTEHDEAALGAAFDPQGSRIAVAGSDGKVRLWNARDGRLEKTVRDHDGPVLTAVFSLDGLRLATSGDEKDNHVRVWDLASDRPPRVLDAPATGESRDVRWSKDYLAAAGPRGAQVWRADNLRLVATMPHDNMVRSVRFDAAGQRLVTASWDRTVRIWQLPSGKLIRTLYGASERVEYAEFSPDGDEVVAAARDGAAHLWDAKSGALRLSLRGRRGTVWQAEFDQAGRRILTAGDDGSVRIWDRKSGHLISTLEGHTNRISGAHFWRDGSRVISAAADGGLALWNTSDPYLLSERPPLADWINNLGQGANRLAVAGPKATRVFATGGDKPQMFELPGADFVAAGATRIVTASGTQATVWQTAGLRKERVLSVSAAITGIDVTADRLLLVGARDGIAHLWQLPDGRELAALPGHAEGVSAVAFSPDGSRFATAAQTGTLYIRQSEGGKLVSSFDAPRSPALLEFSRSGDLLAVAGAGGPTIVVADVASGRIVSTLRGLHAQILAMHFNRTGTRLVASSFDGSAMSWELPSGRLMSVFSGESQYLADVAFDPTERILAAADGDGDVTFYDVATGRRLGTIAGMGSPAAIVAYTGADQVAVASAFGGFSLWKVPRDQQAADELRDLLSRRSPLAR